MKKIYILFLLIFFWHFSRPISALQFLSGRILLQVEEAGQAWYVYPGDQKKYYLGRPTDAFNLMNQLGLGINNNNLARIPVGLLEPLQDSDGDLVDDQIEESLGTNKNSADSDDDGYTDYLEITNGYNPLGEGSSLINQEIIENNSGRILLQVEEAGQAWYLNPVNNKRYYLGRPEQAWLIMKKLSLGITNKDLEKIETGEIEFTPDIPEIYPTCSSCHQKTAAEVLAATADAIRRGDVEGALMYYEADIRQAITYSINFLDNEGLLSWGNLISSAHLQTDNENEKIYSTQVNFSLTGYPVNLEFYLNKQADGNWLISQL